MKYNMKCKCGSYAINPNLHGRDNTDLDLCDVCYWRKRVNDLKSEIRISLNKLTNCSPLEIINAVDDHVMRMRKISDE